MVLVNLVQRRCCNSAFFFCTEGGGSDLRLWTVNGDLIGHVHCRETIRSLAFSNQPEGVSVNVIAGGLENGVVRYEEPLSFNFTVFSTVEEPKNAQ